MWPRISLLSLLIDSILLHIVSVLDKDSWICPCSQEHHSCFCRVRRVWALFSCSMYFSIYVWWGCESYWFESVMLCLGNYPHIAEWSVLVLVYSVSTKNWTSFTVLCVLLRMNSSTSNRFFSPRPHHLNYSSKSPPLPLVFETPLSALEIFFQTNTISF